ncbi:MAG: hypothetical protein EU540_00340 [Promethearchaeota archaeon]|nr:MAG: hypothetical protein EU540_00340 [Candidatus Lokiarchaeota archaeon]
MPKGIFIIKWDVVEGGTVYMRYPEELEIPDNAVQQIQIAHNFTESYIITEEKDWNSVSFYNSEKEIVIVLVLDKFDEGNDYLIVLEEFNKDLYKYENENELKEQLEKRFKFSLKVFRTRDEVITKLSNDVANVKMRVYELEKKIERIIESNHLTVKARILFLLAANDQLSFLDIKKQLNTSKRWLESVIETLIKDKIVAYNNDTKTYYISF